ncbi:polyprenyl synthetase family protein [Sinimarinibacterium sp. NLF-5-8]|uniref:polyprenyl synthetase family protein n=1 Tax=Sinimarinibacterium sp. NLF-5-8 TaxID=2698684 RepID=UPI00137C2F66|nr:farnesyl diphosphate synthase [Sinimarinibacterium sp. NLF-5-8]QHS09619.1 geranyl transferase [Sinimarinibacterium sp. NLF-5-8]
MTLTSFSDLRARFDHALDRCLRLPNAPEPLNSAMRYSCEGGKRLRPLLIYSAGSALGMDHQRDRLDLAACAMELIHVYSLVHDDLPAMDDDAMRRGRPTTHIAFDEATAILVGDALQTRAFELLSAPDAACLNPAQRLQMINVLARAAGALGMAGGQSLDLAAEYQTLDLPALERLHQHKTGALIEACMQLACLAADDCALAQVTALHSYGRHIGLAFQIQDDVLDVQGSAATLGKTAGKDMASGKSTYPGLLGLSAAQQRADELFNAARAALAPLGSAAQMLLMLTDAIEHREH